MLINTIATAVLAATAAAPAPQQALLPEGAANEIAEAIPRIVESWPLETIAIPAVALVAGFVLWAAGSRLIRPVFAVLGLALGAGVGYLVLPQMGWETIFGLASPVAGLIGGGLIGLILALLLYRLTMGLSTGTALAFAAALGAGAYLHAYPTPEPTPTLPDPLTAPEMLLDGIPLDTDVDALTRTLRQPEGAYEEAHAVAGEFTDWAKETWDELAVRDRVVLLGATLGALTLGLAFGLAAPKKASILISAPFGAAVWLTSSVWLLWIFEVGFVDRIKANPALSLITWGVVSVLGIFVQLGGARRGKSSNRRDRDDHDDERDEDDE